MTDCIANPLTEAPTRKRRRWLPRFGLRTLLLLLLLAAIPLGFVAKRLHYARRQAAVVEAVKSLDGWAIYDYQMVVGASRAKPSPWATRLPFLGVDFFHDVVQVRVAPESVYSSGGIIASNPYAVLQRELDRKPPSDALGDHLRGMTRLKSLTLDMQDTTNASLEAISTLKGLEKLELIKLTRGHDISLLGQLPQLKNMSIIQPNLTGDAIAQLPKQPKLQVLHVNMAMQVNGLCGTLSRHPDLALIDLSQTDVDDDGIRSLAACRSLLFLHLRQTNVTGTAFAAQDTWPALRELDVGMCLIDDRTLPFVAHLPAVRWLKADRNSITRERIGGVAWSRSLKTIILDCDPEPRDEHLLPFVELPKLSSLILNGQECILGVRKAQTKQAGEQ